MSYLNVKCYNIIIEENFHEILKHNEEDQHKYKR